MSTASHRPIPPGVVHRSGELPEDFADGAALLVDKPTGRTSFDVVRTVRSRVRVRKVGHAGTLDPLASGLLILLVARPATRLQSAFMDLPKTYVGTVRLGETTPSHDSDTAVVERCSVDHLTMAELEVARDGFLGLINQVPPMYSAVKVGGERLYEKARRGETVDRPPRQVRIDAFDLTSFDGRDVTFRVECSKGTYVRSLARDLGAALDVGGHVIALRRTDIGPYSVDDAWSLDALTKALETR